MSTSPRSKTYPRMHAAPKQKEIGRQRKTVRPRQSSPRFKRVGSHQSTLTQLDYVQTPHSNNRRETIAISSDEDEENYEERRRSKRTRKSTRTPGEGKEEDDMKSRPVKRRKMSTDPAAKQKVQSKREGKNNFRHTVRSRYQSTMTQKWDYTTPRLEIPDSEDEGEQTAMGTAFSFEGYRNEESRDQEVDTRHNGGISQTSTVKASAKRLMSFLREDNDADSESETSPRPPKHTRCAASPDSEQSSTRATTANSNKPLATPNKLVRTVIPSSVTPSTISSSGHSVRKSQVNTRSPLEERSVNIVGASGRTPRSVSNVASEAVKIPWNSEPSQKHSSSAWTAKLTITPKKQTRRFERVTTIQDSEGESDWELSPVTMKPLASVFTSGPSKLPVTSQKDVAGDTQTTLIRLVEETTDPRAAAQSLEWRRTGVVQNSEECSLSTGSSPSGGGRPIEPATMQEDLTIPSQPAEVTQTIEVDQNLTDLDHQIRQREREDRDSTPSPKKPQVAPLQTEQSNLLDECENNTDEHYYMTDAEGQVEDDNEHEDFDLYQQYTYDPVAAALERDAACFGMTETQLNAEEQMSNQEESYMDLDLKHPGTNPKVAQPDAEVEFVPSSQPGEKIAMLDKSSGDIDDSGYGSHEEFIPSSQPGEKRFQVSDILPRSQHHNCSSSAEPTALSTQQPPFHPRPSQISTVCDTQSEKTDSRPNTAHGIPAAPGDEEEKGEDGKTVPTPPEKLLWNNNSDEAVGIDTLSSSPFPLPPGVTKLVHTGDTQITLTDFSLPPPPPLNWSSSLWDGND